MSDSDSALAERLLPGDHICWTFEHDQGRDRALAGYVRAAIPLQHKVIYFPYTRTPEESRSDLSAAGIDVDALAGAGQLEIFGGRDAYLGSGGFDAAAMVASCLDACAQAQAAGFPGLRLAGDMSWAAEPGIAVEDLAGYEAQVNRVYAQGYAIGLCLYDGRLFERSQVRGVLAAHPGAVDGSVGDSWTPLLRIRQSAAGSSLRLDGATDLSNRGCLVAMLDTLTPGQDIAPTIDVRALRFADVPTAHAIVVAAARLGGLRVVGASAQLARLLSFVGGDRVPDLVVQTAELSGSAA